jgi:hypothetical protein
MANFITGALIALALALAATNWALVLRIRQLLKDRHPETWRALAGASSGLGRLGQFMWRRGDRLLGDAELTRKTKQFRLVSILTYALLGGWVMLVLGSMEATARLG